MTSQIQRQQGSGVATSATFDDARAASEALREYAQQFNLVSPATSVGALPEGCEIVVGHVFVDTRTEERPKRNGPGTYLASVSGDIYHTEGGRWGLSKTVLNRIAAAAGVKWHVSRRMDDGSHPYYVHWYVEGNYRSFDGATHTINGSKVADLRNGSPAASKLRDGLPQARAFIAEMAESKAKLRAIKDAFGIKGGYTLEELKKPFVTARVMFNGRSEDPETQRMFSRAIAASFLDSSSALFGAPQTREPEPARLPPPDAGVDDSGEWPIKENKEGPEAGREPAETSPEMHADGANPDLELKFSRSKGHKVRDARTVDLEWIAATVSANLGGGNSRYPDSDRKLLAAVRAELTQRKAGNGASE